MIIYTDDDIIKPELDTEDMFSKEIREFISCVCGGKESEISSCQSVLNSMKIIDAEIKSTEDNGTKKVI